MPTRQDVDTLKRQWMEEPIWDLAETGGFDEYREELKNFQLEMNARWEMQQQETIKAYAIKLGIPDNLQLAEYIHSLEVRLIMLEAE